MDVNQVNEWIRSVGEGKYWSIYVHEFPDGKKYVGMTSQMPLHRWGHNGNAYKCQVTLWKAIEDAGWDNIGHKILALTDSHELAEECEQYFIREFKTNIPEFGYNIESGGDHAKGHHLNQETRHKMSNSRRGAKNWIFGKHMSEETKRKLSESHKGKINLEAVRKGAKKRMGANAHNARAVCLIDKEGKTIKRFEALILASEETGVRVQDIHNCCVGRQKTAHGTRWAFAE